MRCLSYGKKTFKILRSVPKNRTQYCCRCVATEVRTNYVNIQMLSGELHSQIFKDVSPQKLSDQSLTNVKEHLTQHGLWDKSSSQTESLAFDLPELYGKNIGEHFERIGRELTSQYFALAEHMSNTMTHLPPKPRQWLYKPGWTLYKVDGTTENVVCPEEDVVVFDVEVCMQAGNVPILATAVSKRAW